MNSLNKSFEIMETVANGNSDGVRLSEIISSSGLNRATATRIVSLLVKNKYLSQMEKRGKYTPGPKLRYINELLNKNNNIHEIAMPHLARLNRAVDESVNLFNWDGKRYYCIGDVPSNYPLRIIPPAPNNNPPLHCTAIGKMFLAHMNEQDLDEYFKTADLKAYTSNTITDSNLLRNHIKVILKEGISYDDEEHYVGMRSVVAGIKNITGKVVYCVGVLGPSVRLTRSRMIEITPDVKLCAKNISMAIGYKEPHS